MYSPVYTPHDTPLLTHLGPIELFTTFVYLVEADVPFLCGKRTLESWDAKLDTKNRIMETKIEGEKRNFRMINTGSDHFGIVIGKKEGQEEEVLYTKGK